MPAKKSAAKKTAAVSAEASASATRGAENVGAYVDVSRLVLLEKKGRVVN